VDHYPLIIVTVFNRRAETETMLRSLAETTEPGEAHIVLIDNGSSDGAAQVVRDAFLQMQERDFDVDVHLLEQNIGCPAALNFAIELHRWGAQPVVKLDNDVEIVTPEWVEKVGDMIETMRSGVGELYHGPPAMIGAMLGEKINRDRLVSRDPYEIHGANLWQSSPIIGHAVWHDGDFMDEIGYFDVLADDHLYGFEDLIASHKAAAWGAICGIWEGWRVRDLQRHSAMPRAEQDEHVARMRPLHDRRVADLQSGGSIWTGANGRPADRP